MKGDTLALVFNRQHCKVLHSDIRPSAERRVLSEYTWSQVRLTDDRLLNNFRTDVEYDIHKIHVHNSVDLRQRLVEYGY